MMPDTVSELARQLAENAEAVCRTYLSSGCREGRYWRVGDVHNTPGRSLYVCLFGPRTGRWTDAATGEYGDLLDLIAANRGFDGIGDTLDEARRLLGRVPPNFVASSPAAYPVGSPETARRLFHVSGPIVGSLASTYLQARGIGVAPDWPALRFHPCCWYRSDPDNPDSARESLPALIAAVTTLDGTVMGVQRTWLDLTGQSKALIVSPRRAMGQLLGHAVRFGAAGNIMAVGEGIETMLSLHSVMPGLPLAAALSATNLAALRLPPTLRRLYIVRDNDHAGQHAVTVLTPRAQAAGIEVLILAPMLGDLNDDLRQRGAGVLAASLRRQLAPEDVIRFWRMPETDR